MFVFVCFFVIITTNLLTIIAVVGTIANENPFYHWSSFSGWYRCFGHIYLRLYIRTLDYNEET